MYTLNRKLHDPNEVECRFMLKLIGVVDVISSWEFLLFFAVLPSGTGYAPFMGSSFRIDLRSYF